MSDEIAASFLRATGYLELGLVEDALAELDGLPPEEQGISLVLHLRVDAYFRMEKWQEASEICLPMLEREPDDAAWWIQSAFSVRRSDSIAKAEEILRRGLGFHPRHSLIHYNLACYACVQGREDEAFGLLAKVAPEELDLFLKMAKGDPDLKTIRPRILHWQEERASKPKEP